MDASRYLSQIVMPEIGLDGQQKINKGSILIVGMGGLGNPVALILTGMGIGRLRIVDNDLVSLPNLHRQLLFDENDVGKLKVEAGCEKLARKNKEVCFEPLATRFSEENCEELCSGIDLIIDCTDNMASRYLIDSASKKLGIPFIYGGVNRWEGQVAIFNVEGGVRFTDLYPEPLVSDNFINCAEGGVTPVITNLISSLQANEAIRFLLNSASTTTGFLITIDLSTYVMKKFRIKA